MLQSSSRKSPARTLISVHWTARSFITIPSRRIQRPAPECRKNVRFWVRSPILRERKVRPHQQDGDGQRPKGLDANPHLVPPVSQ